jgi:HEAT repeat protein
MLRESLKHESAQIRAAAIAALGAIGNAANAAEPDLVSALKDVDRDVRHAAVRSIRTIELESDSVVRGLIDVMQDARDQESTGQLAVKSLAKLASQHAAAVDALRESTKDRNYGVSSLAKQFLKRIDAE